MAATQKRGFRLPWSAERGSAEGGATTTETSEDASDAAADQLGDGPFRLGESAPATAPEAAEPTPVDAAGASDEPSTIEAAMNDAEPASPESSPRGTAATLDAGTSWPTTDRAAARKAAEAADAAAARPPIRVASAAARPPRRDNPLVAGLVKAMREAAIASREETTARLRAEAAARMEAIRERGTTDAAELRKQADEDVAAIREWSKAELARVRQQTEDRIEARRHDLTGEGERHAAAVERKVSEVEATVVSFEAEMEEFFKRLLAEDDPARLATLAEQAPEPPDLTEDGVAAVDWQAADADVEAEAEADVDLEESSSASAMADDGFDADVADAIAARLAAVAPMSDPEPEPEPEPAAEPTPAAAAKNDADRKAAANDEPDEAALEADDAAAAEDAAVEGLDLSGATDEQWPAVTLAASRRGEAPTAAAAEPGPEQTHLVVTGLTSVAGISALKGALGGVAGVRSVSVSSGERGAFVFAVSHGKAADLRAALPKLQGFAARITDDTGTSLAVTAHEPAA